MAFHSFANRRSNLQLSVGISLPRKRSALPGMRSSRTWSNGLGLPVARFWRQWTWT